jgi:hypothetical protein
MKIRKLAANNRRKAFKIEARNETLLFPYARLRLAPTTQNRVAEAYPDPELGREAFTYVLDQTNYRKSIGQLLALPHVLDCDVDLVVRTRKRETASRAR